MNASFGARFAPPRADDFRAVDFDADVRDVAFAVDFRAVDLDADFRAAAFVADFLAVDFVADFRDVAFFDADFEADFFAAPPRLAAPFLAPLFFAAMRFLLCGTRLGSPCWNRGPSRARLAAPGPGRRAISGPGLPDDELADTPSGMPLAGIPARRHTGSQAYR
jgi:hypothetical protein